MRDLLTSRMHGDRGSIPIALLVVIIGSSLMAVLIAQTLAAQRQVDFDRDFTSTLPAADAGAQVALFRLNNNSELVSAVNNQRYVAEAFPAGHNTIQYSTVIDGDPVTWWLYRRTASEIAAARASSPEPAREPEWVATSVGRVDGVTRRVVTGMREDPLTTLAAFSDRRLQFRGSNSADSYNSTARASCTGNGYVASNEVVDFNGSAGTPCHSSGRTVDGVELHDWAANPGAGATAALPGGSRCVHSGGSNCQAVATYPAPDIFLDRLDLASPAAVAFIAEQLDRCRAGGPLQARTLTGNSTLAPGTYCYSSLTFATRSDTRLWTGSGPTTAPGPQFPPVLPGGATAENPVRIFVDGTVAFQGVGANASVTNVPDDFPVAGALQVYVLNGPVTFGNHAKFGGVLYAPRADCTSGTTQNDIYGSMICGTIGGGGGFRFHYDDALGEVGAGRWTRTSWREELPTG